MNRCPLVLLSLLLAPGAWAQRPRRAGYVYPAGGQQGTTFEAVVGGQYLLNSTYVFVTGAGVRVTVAEQEELLTRLPLFDWGSGDFSGFSFRKLLLMRLQISQMCCSADQPSFSLRSLVHNRRRTCF